MKPYLTLQESPMSKQFASLLFSSFAVLSLNACQTASLPTQHPPQTGLQATASSPETAPAKQLPESNAGKSAVQLLEPPALEARIQRQGAADRLILRLGRSFKTQSLDFNTLSTMVVTVTGPGIASPIVSDPINVTGGGPYSLELNGIPPGVNRVVTAQFYDADDNAIPIAIAMGVYSSSSNGELNIALRRRYLPLGQILQALTAELRASVDANALQATLDDLLFGSNDPETGPFEADPSLVDIDAIVADLTGNAGLVGNYANPVYLYGTGSVSYDINGLQLGQKLKIRLMDPTSGLVESQPASIPGIGHVDGEIENVTPGTYKARIYLPEGLKYSFDRNYNISHHNLSWNIIEGDEHDARVLETDNIPITAGLTWGGIYATVTYPTPLIESISVSEGSQGSQVTLTGTGFHAVKEFNAVNFHSDTASPQENPATVISASNTQLIVEVPNVSELGTYILTTAIDDKTSSPWYFTVKEIWHVTDNGTIGANGQSWASAVTLQDALARAGQGAEIWVKGGSAGNPLVYKPHASERSQSFKINRSLSLYGGFAGNESNLSERDPQAHPVVLSGDLAGNDGIHALASKEQLDPASGLRSDNSYNVLINQGANTRIEDLTIEGGNANAAEATTIEQPEPDCNPAAPNIINCDPLELPNPQHHGAGIFNRGGLTLNQVVIRRNSAIGSGGGIFGGYGRTAAGYLTISENVDYFNYSQSGYQLSQISENRSLSKGGGIFLDKMEDRLGVSQISHNFALSGAGIYLAGENTGTYSGLFDLRLLDNHAEEDGGGMYNERSYGQLSRSVFADNSAGRHGGGLMYTNAGTSYTYFDSFNTVFAQNQALSGGGLYFNVDSPGAESKLSYATFYKNQATAADGETDPESDGSAVYLRGDSTLILNSTLLFDNSLARGSDLSYSIVHCLFAESDLDELVHDDGSLGGTAATGSDNQANVADPRFKDTSALDGGDAWGSGIEGLRPLSDSLAKNNAEYNEFYAHDLTGLTRPAQPTIGAYEAE